MRNRADVHSSVELAAFVSSRRAGSIETGFADHKCDIDGRKPVGSEQANGRLFDEP
jgi:hypothetical protein